VKLYRYEGVAELEHKMFLSYGVRCIDKHFGKHTSTDKLIIAA
jgi:hypothetical protein